MASSRRPVRVAAIATLTLRIKTPQIFRNPVEHETGARERVGPRSASRSGRRSGPRSAQRWAWGLAWGFKLVTFCGPSRARWTWGAMAPGPMLGPVKIRAEGYFGLLRPHVTPGPPLTDHHEYSPPRAPAVVAFGELHIQEGQVRGPLDLARAQQPPRLRAAWQVGSRLGFLLSGCRNPGPLACQ